MGKHRKGVRQRSLPRTHGSSSTGDRGKHPKEVRQRSVAELVTEAATHAAAARHKEALKIYTELYRREQKDEWREALQQTYLARARQLADKGLYKEAAALWENMAQVSGNSINRIFYLACLINSGYYAKAGQLYKEASQELDNHLEARPLLGFLAALYLTGKLELSLPADDPLAAGRHAALEALRAYCRGDDPQAESELKRIPFRSPYKDLSVVLKGAMCLERDPEEAQKRLAKIPDTSPFFELAHLFSICTLEGEAFYLALNKLSRLQLDFVAGIRRLEKSAIAVLGALERAALRGKGNARAFFKFVVDNHALFDRDRAAWLCHALLPHYPQGLAQYEKVFGRFTPFEQHRINALAEERQGDPDAAQAHWKECVSSLMRGKRDKDKRLMIALILRHMAELEHQSRDPDPKRIQRLLEDSLAFDAEDKACHLKLIEIYKTGSSKADYQWCIDRAVKQFSEDSEILSKAVEASLERRTFKKAADLAEKLLQRDPINNRVRQQLIWAHVAHARKLILAQKFERAQQELASAAGFERAGAESDVVRMNQGFLEILAGRNEQGEALIKEGLRLYGGGVAAEFKLYLEALRVRLEERRLKLYCKALMAHKKPASKEEVLTLVGVANSYLAEDASLVGQALDMLTPYFKESTHFDYSVEEMRSVCECLFRSSGFEGLSALGAAANERWPERHEFLFYGVFASSKGRAERVPVHQIEALEEAATQAMQRGDTLTAKRIIEFITPALGSFPFKLPTPKQLAEFMDKFLGEDGDEDWDEDEPPPPQPKPHRSRKKGSPEDLSPQGDLFNDESF
jgi:hypothetical protein